MKGGHNELELGESLVHCNAAGFTKVYCVTPQAPLASLPKPLAWVWLLK